MHQRGCGRVQLDETLPQRKGCRCSADLADHVGYWSVWMLLVSKDKQQGQDRGSIEVLGIIVHTS
jgi:hypothetical protein